MSTYQFGFIGCGNMGGALVRAVSKQIAPDRILIADFLLSNVTRLCESCGVCAAQSAEEVAAQAEYIFLGVKPQGLGELLAQLAPTLRARTDRVVLISMAAGVTLASIEDMLGTRDIAIVRIMPNTPVSVGKGVILYCCNDRVTDEEEQAVTAALASAGVIDPLEESLIDAGCAVAGCGPAFADLFIEALADGAVACGLPRQKALLYAAQMVAGSAEMQLQTGKHPGELKDAVCSPGGATIRGVHALEQGAFRAAVMDAVVAAYERTRELGKK